MDVLCIEILNSNHTGWRHDSVQTDLLDHTDWLQALLEKWQLPAALPIPSRELAKLKALRENMRSVIAALRSGVDLQRPLQEINRVLASEPLYKQLVNRGDCFVAEYDCSLAGWPLVVFRTADSFVQLLCEFDTARIKLCDNADCQWVFYDESKNKSRRWCDDKVCGNIMKVRRFRARQKDRPSQP